MSDHEERFDQEIRSKLLVGLGLGLAAITVIAAFAAFGVQKAMLNARTTEDPAPPVMSAPPTMVSGPQLLSNPERLLDQSRAKDAEVLDHYAIVDEASGTVRIPIERAIEVVAAGDFYSMVPGPVPAAAVEPVDETAPNDQAEDGSDG